MNNQHNPRKLGISVYLPNQYSHVKWTSFIYKVQTYSHIYYVLKHSLSKSKRNAVILPLRNMIKALSNVTFQPNHIDIITKMYCKRILNKMNTVNLLSVFHS